MATNFRQYGRAMYVTAPAAVNSGQLLAIGAVVGVCGAAAASGGQVALHLVGNYDIPKDTGKAFTQGEPVYWNTASPWTLGGTGFATGLFKLGVAAAAAASSATKVEVRLNGVF